MAKYHSCGKGSQTIQLWNLFWIHSKLQKKMCGRVAYDSGTQPFGPVNQMNGAGLVLLHQDWSMGPTLPPPCPKLQEQVLGPPLLPLSISIGSWSPSATPTFGIGSWGPSSAPSQPSTPGLGPGAPCPPCLGLCIGIRPSIQHAGPRASNGSGNLVVNCVTVPSLPNFQTWCWLPLVYE